MRYARYYEWGYGKRRAPGIKIDCADWPAWEAGVLLALDCREWWAHWRFPC